MFKLRTSLIGLAFILASGTTAAGNINSNCITTNESINAGNIVVGEVNTIGLADIGTPVCSNAHTSPCTIITQYQVKYDLSTGLGTASGQMKLVGPLVPGLSSPDEIILDTFPLNGKFDLSPALLRGMPNGSFDGTAIIKGQVYKLHVAILLPIPCGGPIPFCYLTNDNPAQLLPATSADLATAIPGKATIRFVSSFAQ